MAEIFSPSIGDTDPETLDNYLKDKRSAGYSPEDLSQIEAAFTILQDRLSQGEAAVSITEDEPSDEGISARAARINASPVVRILPRGTFAAGILSPGENIRFVGFGTISKDLYCDMVWEAVQRLPGYTSFETGVYDMNRTSGLRFEILFKGHLFEFKYFQTEALARSNQEIWEISDTFLLQNHCGSDVQEAVRDVRDSIAQKNLFAENPSYRRAYYTIRSWAILRGMWTQQSCKALLRSFTAKQFDHNQTLKDVFGLGRRARPYQENTARDWTALLKILEGLPVSGIIEAPYYLTINIIIDGCSNVQAGKWHLLLESRFPKLSENLNTSFASKYIGRVKASFKQWPYRLTSDSSAVAESKVQTYEGCFLISINFVPSPAEQQQIDEVVQKWLSYIQRHENTLPESTIIYHQLHTPDSIEEMSLEPCPRKFPRVFLPAPNPIDDEDSAEDGHKATKKSKKQKDGDQAVATATPTTKLSTVTEVHNRLKHDPRYRIEEYVIGYRDFAKIVEMRAEDWTRETTDDAFIPESRVHYFKRYFQGQEEVVWHREERIDKMRKGAS